MEEYLQKAAQLVAVGLEKLEQIPVLKHVWFPTEYEQNFNGAKWLKWCMGHDDVPIFAATSYLFMVFYLPEVMKNRKALSLKVEFRLWNLLLTVFSILGSTRLFTHLVKAVVTNGSKWTICTDPKLWYMNGPPGLWMSLFIYSKIPELFDTLFLILQKKEVIFLHWFHHVTVMLYCWHAYTNRIGPGIWFGGINYMVHSVMYMYYFLMTFSRQSKFIFKIALKMQMPITICQILQMVVGSYVTVMGMRYVKEGDQPCRINESNSRLGLAMYISYFMLFVIFFYNKYIAKKQKAVKEGTSGVCGTDAAGMFRAGNAPKDGLSREPSRSDKKAN